MKPCKICSLPPRTRKAIDRALIEGATSGSVAKRFASKVSKSGMRRHSKHVLATTPEARRLARGQEVLDTSSVDKIRRIEAEHWSVYDAARASGQLANANQALREIAQNAERLSVLSGEMAQARAMNMANVTINEKLVTEFLQAVLLRPDPIKRHLEKEVTRILGPRTLAVRFVKPDYTVDAAGYRVDANGDRILQLPAKTG